MSRLFVGITLAVIRFITGRGKPCPYKLHPAAELMHIPAYARQCIFLAVFSFEGILAIS